MNDSTLMHEYAVYKRQSGQGQSYLGTVEAADMTEAVDKAHAQYGGFIEIERTDDCTQDN